MIIIIVIICKNVIIITEDRPLNLFTRTAFTGCGHQLYVKILTPRAIRQLGFGVNAQISTGISSDCLGIKTIHHL